jgi:hypothetical protein
MQDDLHTKMLEVADLSWYFGQVVIGQNEGLDFKMLPYFVRHKTEVLLPDVEIHAVVKRHVRILACSQQSFQDFFEQRQFSVTRQLVIAAQAASRLSRATFNRLNQSFVPQLYLCPKPERADLI